MSRKVCVNLPVKDLSRSADLFAQVGLAFDPDCTDERCIAPSARRA